MINTLVSNLLNQARTKAASALPTVLRRSVGTIDDVIVRPANRFVQENLTNPLRGSARTFLPGAKAEQLVRQQTGRSVPFIMSPASDNAPRYTQSGAQRFLQEFGNVINPAATRTAASLRPGPGAVGFPLDNPITRLQATGQYLTRQGINLFQAAQNLGPTALNPLATRVPTTRLGQVGSLFNPLNPRNAAGIAIGMIPGLSEKDKGLLQGAFVTPGGPIPKVLSAMVMHDINNPLGPSDAEEAALIRRYSGSDLRPFGGDSSIKNEEGKVWGGKYYGFQSPESFNKLYGANLPTAPGGTPPPAPVLPPPPEVVDRRAGQQTVPPAAPVAPGTLSNGAGVPAQRQDVQQRALSQEVLNAAQQYAAPTSVPLSSFYEGQQQLGRSLLKGGVLQQQLQELGGARGMTTEALSQWAQANPGLAYSLLEKMKRSAR